jgi:AcrR family transcriptional regulator
MSPRPRDPETAARLVEVGARLMADEGIQAVTARRLAREIGSSTMAVYTHFGSMDDLMAELWRTGFTRFGAALDSPAVTNDPVADWMAQGWQYRRFALDNPHLYRVMFSDGLVNFKTGDPADYEAAMATFLSLLTRIERCVEVGRWRLDDVFRAGEVVWATTHGHCMIELTGYFDAMDRDAEAIFRECLLRLALGFHDDESAVRRSMSAAARRRGGRRPKQKAASGKG